YDDLKDKEEEELLRLIGEVRDDHPVAVVVRRILGGRNEKRQREINDAMVSAAEGQAQAAAQQATAAQEMIAPTRTLARATNALLVVSLVAFCITVVQAYLTDRNVKLTD